MLLRFEHWARLTLLPIHPYPSLLAVVLLLAVGLHAWSAYQGKQLNRAWSEAKALHLHKVRLRLLTVWLGLVWMLVVVEVLQWVR